MLGIIKISGINKTISMSKTKKITANRKNRIEKGRRADDKGSNPHSNGEIFSRSLVLWREIVIVTTSKAIGISILNIVVIKT